jgi:Zn-dependent protease
MSTGPTYPYGYSWTSTLPRTGRVSTSRSEVMQIAIAYAVLTFDLTILLGGTGALFGTNATSLPYLVTAPIVAVAAVAALTGFVAHEMAHKVVAQRSGYWAEFRWSVFGLVFSVVTSLFGVLFAAPGATVVSGMTDTRLWGRTALAGPSINVAFGAVFYGGALLTFSSGSNVFDWFLLLAFINFWFATFNLIPLGPLDGAKVLRWSAGVWAATIAIAGALGVVSWLAYFYYGTPFLHA